jgi:hypothetical protein
VDVIINMYLDVVGVNVPLSLYHVVLDELRVTDATVVLVVPSHIINEITGVFVYELPLWRVTEKPYSVPISIPIRFVNMNDVTVAFEVSKNPQKVLPAAVPAPEPHDQ